MAPHSECACKLELHVSAKMSWKWLHQMSKFRLRNIRMSAVSGERDARLRLMINAHVHDADDGMDVDVAGCTISICVREVPAV